VEFGRERGEGTVDSWDLGFRGGAGCVEGSVDCEYRSEYIQLENQGERELR